MQRSIKNVHQIHVNTTVGDPGRTVQPQAKAQKSYYSEFPDLRGDTREKKPEFFTTPVSKQYAQVAKKALEIDTSKKDRNLKDHCHMNYLMFMFRSNSECQNSEPQTRKQNFVIPMILPKEIALAAEMAGYGYIPQEPWFGQAIPVPAYYFIDRSELPPQTPGSFTGRVTTTTELPNIEGVEYASESSIEEGLRAWNNFLENVGAMPVNHHAPAMRYREHAPTRVPEPNNNNNNGGLNGKGRSARPPREHQARGRSRGRPRHSESWHSGTRRYSQSKGRYVDDNQNGTGFSCSAGVLHGQQSARQLPSARVDHAATNAEVKTTESVMQSWGYNPQDANQAVRDTIVFLDDLTDDAEDTHDEIMIEKNGQEFPSASADRWPASPEETSVPSNYLHLMSKLFYNSVGWAVPCYTMDEFEDACAASAAAAAAEAKARAAANAAAANAAAANAAAAAASAAAASAAAVIAAANAAANANTSRANSAMSSSSNQQQVVYGLGPNPTIQGIPIHQYIETPNYPQGVPFKPITGMPPVRGIIPIQYLSQSGMGGYSSASSSFSSFQSANMQDLDLSRSNSNRQFEPRRNSERNLRATPQYSQMALAYSNSTPSLVGPYMVYRRQSTGNANEVMPDQHVANIYQQANVDSGQRASNGTSSRSSSSSAFSSAKSSRSNSACITPGLLRIPAASRDAVYKSVPINQAQQQVQQPAHGLAMHDNRPPSNRRKSAPVEAVYQAEYRPEYHFRPIQAAPMQSVSYSYSPVVPAVCYPTTLVPSGYTVFQQPIPHQYQQHIMQPPIRQAMPSHVPCMVRSVQMQPYQPRPVYAASTERRQGARLASVPNNNQPYRHANPRREEVFACNRLIEEQADKEAAKADAAYDAALSQVEHIDSHEAKSVNGDEPTVMLSDGHCDGMHVVDGYNAPEKVLPPVPVGQAMYSEDLERQWLEAAVERGIIAAPGHLDLGHQWSDPLEQDFCWEDMQYTPTAQYTPTTYPFFDEDNELTPTNGIQGRPGASGFSDDIRNGTTDAYGKTYYPRSPSKRWP